MIDFVHYNKKTITTLKYKIDLEIDLVLFWDECIKSETMRS